MSSDRREFLAKPVAISAGLGTFASARTTKATVSLPTQRANALMTQFGLKYPIFSAGRGAVHART